MRTQQQATVSETPSHASVSDVWQRYLDRIANDPDYAADQAKKFVQGPELALLGHNPFPKNGAPNSEWQAFWKAHNARAERVAQVHQERRGLYEDLASKGTPPAEIYAELLNFNVSQPESYDAVMSFSEHLGVSYSDSNRAMFDYLQQAIAKAPQAENA